MITRQARSQIGEMPIKLPLFFSRSKPPKSFATTAVVGLRIVAAMGNSTEQPNTLTSAAVPTPSSPIPITPATSTWKGIQVVEEEEELSESYTCVISHVGKEYVKKRMYYREADDDNMVMNMDMDTDTKMDATIHRRCDKDEPSLFYHSSPATPVATLRFDFLEFCCGCRKRLEGIDIFMYRGEKAFCSTDCRHHQIMADEYHEKFASKSHNPFDCSASPCSAPMFLAAGVAAA